MEIFRPIINQLLTVCHLVYLPLGQYPFIYSEVYGCFLFFGNNLFCQIWAGPDWMRNNEDFYRSSAF
jgi:hypothetical protein